MKKILCLICIALLSFACSKENEAVPKTDFSLEINEMSENTLYKGLLKSDDGKGVTITCQGSCSCQTVWQIGSDVVTCSCTPCNMHVIFDKLQTGGKGNAELEEQYNSLIQSEFFKKSKSHLDDYLTKELGLTGSIEVITMKFQADSDHEIMTITFKTPSGEEETLLSVYNTQLKTTYVINCTGNCGCMPQYNLETHIASCSCSPCNLTVSQK